MIQLLRIRMGCAAAIYIVQSQSQLSRYTSWLVILGSNGSAWCKCAVVSHESPELPQSLVLKHMATVPCHIYQTWCAESVIDIPHGLALKLPSLRSLRPSSWWSCGHLPSTWQRIDLAGCRGKEWWDTNAYNGLLYMHVILETWKYGAWLYTCIKKLRCYPAHESYPFGPLHIYLWCFVLMIYMP